MTEQQSGIRLKQTRRFDVQFSVLAGVFAVFVLFMCVSSGAAGDWSFLWFWVVPVGMVLIGKIIQHQLAEDYVVLYPDRMEFPQRRGAPSIVKWADVESIRWAKSGRPESQVYLTVPKDAARPFGTVPIDVDGISRADRVTLIRYLRTAGATIEQTGWPQFCRERAIPLVEALQRKERENASVAQPASDASLTCYGRAFSRSAFAWGMLCVVLLPLFLWRLVSRKMWWTLAIVIGISGLVNIRLIWGAWVSPFAESWLVVVALLVVAAAASPPDDKHPERAATFSMTPVAASLAAFIIGFPLLLNAMVLGWVRILVPKEIAWLIVMTPCLLIIVVMLRTGRQEQRNVANMEDEAVRRWDEYSATGILPDAGVSGSMGE